MKTDRPIDDDAEATNQWLNGLAGRPGIGADHQHGTRHRSALAPDARDAPVATWHDIEARARATAVPDRGSEPADPHPRAGDMTRVEAANDPRPRRWLGWAAALLLGVGLVTIMAPPRSDPALRGVTGAASQLPRWLVENPSKAAEALAIDLRGLNAEVIVTQEGQAVILDIRAQPGATAAVNARLAALETGLDAEGRLRLTVLPVR